MSSTLRVLLLAVVIAAPLAACGNKGPLVLPDKPQEQQDKDKREGPAREHHTAGAEDVGGWRGDAALKPPSRR